MKITASKPGMKVYLIHGAYGHPDENWFTWLKEQLKQFGYETIVPQFPTPQNQNPEAWFLVFENYRKYVNPETILIGHSCGGAFLLRVMENLDRTVKAAVYVAASAGVRPIKYYEVDRPFVEKPFDWDRIRRNAEHSLVFHSPNDLLICIENGELIAEKLEIDLISVSNAGHFNAAAGYTKFELLLEKLRPILKN